MTQRVKLYFFSHGPLLTTITVFILAYIIGAQLYPAMQKPQAFFNLFINNGALLIVGIGMTLVMLTGGIDLSVGGVLALTTAASAALLKIGVSPAIVMPLMLIMGTALGCIMGSIIHFFKVQPFIATLMGLFLARGLAYIISLTSVTIKDSFYKDLALTQIPIPFIEKAYVYIPSLVGPLLLIIAVFIMYFTRFGRTIYAIGNNEQSARLMGLPVGQTKIIVYSISGFCSALAGIVFSISLLAGYGQFATGLELDAIASVVMGGTLLTGGVGNVVGTLFGVLIEGTIISILQYNGTLSSWWTRIGVGILTLLFIGIQSLFYVRRKHS
ncbi:MAG: sugar ABC transporter permease YjfF [Chloroflexi bacterium]|nr:sugar ABC transporter permease YjfF [Chloroflexota bacterium]OJV90624.1 MAG: sugar ABC transporter permease YjfF [Chloroflexi bacterium 54-19]